MKVKPMFDRIIAKEIAQEKTTKSGIFIPTSATEKPITAKVVAVGDGGKVGGEEVKMIIKEDDLIIINKYATSEFEIDGEKFIIFRQEDILAKID